MIVQSALTTAKAGYILASIFSCSPAKMPVVEIVFNNMPPKYFNNQTSAQLGQVRVDTTYSHSASEVFETGGLTRGYSSARYQLSYMSETDPTGLQTCTAVEKTTITIDYMPEIYIRSDYVPGTCAYDTTMQHEIRHLNTDIITLKEYLPIFQRTAEATVKAMAMVGPFPASMLNQKHDMMLEKLRQAVTSTIQQMDTIRLQRQQLIDNRAEYLRLSKACPAAPAAAVPPADAAPADTLTPAPY